MQKFHFRLIFCKKCSFVNKIQTYFSQNRKLGNFSPMLLRERPTCAVSNYRNWKSNSNFMVSLPNVREKDVKGLLFRKQPLHTSPNRSKKGEAGVSRLSSLRNLTSPPRWCSRAERQSECSKPKRFGELTLAWISDTILVFLAKISSAAPIDSRSKLERTSLLRFVSLLN